MMKAGLNISEVWPVNLFSGRTEETANAIRSVGLRWNAERVRSFMEGRIKNFVKKEQGVNDNGK